MKRFRSAIAGLTTAATVAAISVSVVFMYTTQATASSSHAVRGTTVRTADGAIHYLPTVNHQAQSTGGTRSNLSYHGGKVMKKSITYAIYWDPPHMQDGSATFFSSMYQTLNNRYFGDVGGQPLKSLYGNNTQYYQIVNSVKTFIKNVSTFGGAYVDTGAFPARACTDSATPNNCLTDAQIKAEVTHVRSITGWTAASTHMFFVFTPKAMGSCASFGCAFTAYCAYHGYFGSTIYANMPYANTFAGNCTTLSSFPNEPDSDVEISVVSHEHMEAVTDPKLNAWWDASTGEEIGDKCAYNYGSRTLDGGLANEQWNGNFYVVQQEWDNLVSGCVQKGP